ncbi:RNA polymerase II transcription factor B subunit 1 [Lecanosticta acicola]|uniref:RNA polymerase II transcription factor B subunit 1 n=1 Tax=Lecanosticta acicola TaxID=111012 RepID=A0AAI9ECB6_9PEZI|nr:RNA polymerase II transcription factor B subunit 1 [Lecanosticta acicola]
MPPNFKVAATYKKKDGTFIVGEDKKNAFWTPKGDATPTVTIRATEITNLQQTPETAKAIALKIIVGDESYVFTFGQRPDQEKTTEKVKELIALYKVKDGPATAAAGTPAAGTPAEGSGGEGQSAAMAIAKAVASKAADEGWYDDNRLKGDTMLQRTLLESNQALKERFNQALKDKPESVSISQFTNQFWSARVHLLRAQAIENAQKQGEYNVLPEIRYVRKVAEKPGEEDILLLNITKEQVRLIFKQYPIVKWAYDESAGSRTGQISQNDFWTRFFKSRLLKKLKGERISQHDERDLLLDKYLDRPEEGAAYPTPHIPHWMDLEGNEQNHSQRKGNRPDEDMRPSGHDKAPILRVLNNLSEKMMAHIAPEDSEAHAPIGMDEDTYEQLRLRDLAMDDVDNRVVLNVREQQRYAGGSQDDLSAEAKLYAKQDPKKVLSLLRSSLQPNNLGADEQGTLRLDRAIGYQTDDDSDDEDEESTHQSNGTAPKKKAKLGSHAAISVASKDIMESIRQRRHAQSSDPTALHGLSQATFDTLTMTHNTTTEFLHYFWSLFLSGDASKSNELAQLVSTLDRSLDRINAVAAQAEAERQKLIEAAKREDKLHLERTKKRRGTNYEMAFGGGRKVVEAMVRPTVQALDRATTAYRKAFEEQTKEANAAGATMAAA